MTTENEGTNAAGAIDRRAFLGGVAAGAAASLLPAPAVGARLDAADKIRLGFIGVGGKGRHAISVAKDDCADLCEPVAICDVHGASLDAAAGMLEGRRFARHTDFRELLDSGEVDAVVVSTPDHWHALPTIHACMAGKDVYVEKPLSLRLEEGRAMVLAARKHQRVVQVGLQQRAGNRPDGLFFRAVDIVRSGVLGKISMVKTWNYGNGYPGMGSPPDQQPPKELDWDLWLGPAPYRPYNPNRCLGSFRWFWDYSGGMVTDWGTHLIDIVQWAMNGQAPGETRQDESDPSLASALPVAVCAFGRKLALEDNRETPDTVSSVVEYRDFILEYEYRDANSMPHNGHGYGIEFYGTRGTLFVDRGGFRLTPEGGRGEPLPAERTGGSVSNHSAEHMRDFLRCCGTREKPACDVEIGHRSTSTPHLINIALQARDTLHWDAAAEEITNHAALNDRLKATYREPWKLPEIQ